MADEKTDKPVQELVVGRRAGATDDEAIRLNAADIEEQVEARTAVLKEQEEQIQKNLVKLNSVKLRLQGLTNSFEQLKKLHEGYKIQSDVAYNAYSGNVKICIDDMRKHLVSLGAWAIHGAQGRVFTCALQMQIHYANFITELETHFLSRPM